MPLEPKCAADVDTKRLFGVGVLLSGNLLDLESGNLVDGLRIRVVYGCDFGVDDRVNRLVELDSLQHEVKAKFDLATVDGVSASFKNLLRDRNLKSSLPSARDFEQEEKITYGRSSGLDDRDQSQNILTFEGCRPLDCLDLGASL